MRAAPPRGSSCWPPSMSYVAPVSAVLVMRCTARAATSSGVTTRPIGRVSRSCWRRSSSPSPSSDADSGVSTKPAAIRLIRTGAISRARLAVSCRKSCGHRRHQPDARGMRAPVPPMNTSAPPGGPCPLRTCHTDHQHRVLLDGPPRLVEVHVGQAGVVRAAGGHHHVVDGTVQALEERLQRRRVVGVERGGAPAPSALRRLEPLLVAAGQDDLGALYTGSPGRLQPDACAAADHDHGLAESAGLGVCTHLLPPQDPYDSGGSTSS